jgi:tellurite resistance protein TerC
MNHVSHISVAPTWLWIGFSVCAFALISLDLWLFGRGNNKISTKVSLIESSIWISVALLFNLWFGFKFGKELGLEFLTGYLVELSLSVDNLFVILMIFASFKIPEKYQHRVLFYGILGAIVLRTLFILLGAQLLNKFHWILYIFGLILIVTAIRLLRDTDKEVEATESWPVRMVKKVIRTTDHIDGKQFFIIENGVRKATPLFLALIVIEVTDLVFAVDSIPAVFAVTRDAFVAFGSNILAILGLRALYFVLANWVAKLRYLKPGLAAVLGFIGCKMLIIDMYKIPNWVSLLVISSILTTAALSSWYVARLNPDQKK